MPLKLLRPFALLGALALTLACAADSSAPRTIRVDLLPSPAGPDAAEPFVARTRDGAVLLSWLERLADSSVALRFATLDQATGAWSVPQDIVRRKDLFVNWADFPSVVPLADGRLLAHWLQKNGTGRYAYDVHLSESRDGGATWGASAFPHPAGVEAEHGFVSILPHADSGASVALLDGSAGASVKDPKQRAMQLGFATWSGGTVTETAIVDQRICDCCQTATAMTSRGPVVVYRDRSDDEVRDMYVVRRVDGAWTAPIALHADGWKIDFCPVNGPALSAVADTLAAVWFTGAQDTARVRMAFSTDAGATFGAPIHVDGGRPTGRVDIEMLDSGAALVSWIERIGGDSAEVWARVVHRDGRLEPPAVVSPSSGTRSSGFPRMVRVPEGVVMAWTVPGKPSTVRVATVRVGAP